MLVIGNKQQSVTLNNLCLNTVDHLRFLGIKITNKGTILPWRTDFNSSLYGVTGRIKAAGLGSLPKAIISGLLLKVVPGLLYGCEAWGIPWLMSVLCQDASPYKWPRLSPLTDFLKSYFGLPLRSFTAAIFRLCNIPSGLALLLPRVLKLLDLFSARQWTVIEAVADKNPNSICGGYVRLRGLVQTWGEMRGKVDDLGRRSVPPSVVVDHLEDKFWAA